MKKNTVRPIPINVELPVKIDFDSLSLNKNGFDVYVYDLAKFGTNPPLLQINFEYIYAQRSLDESSYLYTQWVFDEHSGNNGFIGRIENSDFLEWFHYESCGRYADEKLCHFFINTFEVCVDVITGQLPTLKWIDNPSKE